MPIVPPEVLTTKAEPGHGEATLTPPLPPCPDGVTFCDGDPQNHDRPGDHFHRGQPHAVTAPNGEVLNEITIVQWDGEQIELEFQGSGSWETYDLVQVDNLLAQFRAHTAHLTKARNLLDSRTGSAADTAAEPLADRVAAQGHVFAADLLRRLPELAHKATLKELAGIWAEVATRVFSAVTLHALPEFELDSSELLHAEQYIAADGRHLISLNSQGNGQLFTPEETLAFLDRIDAFTAAVRDMAQGAQAEGQA
ncbi:DUF6907 domain-containing protein [Streptomyces tsukubensis]